MKKIFFVLFVLSCLNFKTFSASRDVAYESPVGSFKTFVNKALPLVESGDLDSLRAFAKRRPALPTKVLRRMDKCGLVEAAAIKAAYMASNCGFSVGKEKGALMSL